MNGTVALGPEHILKTSKPALTKEKCTFSSVPVQVNHWFQIPYPTPR